MSEQLVVLQLAAEEYAISISKVKEIIRYHGATKLPNTPSYMDGIINLRGKVIPVIDLAEKFAVAVEKTADKQVLIVEAASQDVGLVVDEVIEVIRLEERAIEAVRGMAQSSEYIRAIGKVDDRLLIILDLDKLFTQEEITALETASVN